MGLLGNAAEFFWLGVITPLTAICVIPLYPAFLARLSRTVGGRHDDRRLLALFGVLVVAGVISFMALIGLVFTRGLQVSLTRVIGVVSPIAFGVLALIAVLMIFDVKIKRKVRPNRLSNPYLSAFLYGFFFGGVVIPCNPAIITAAFIRASTVADQLANQINFVFYGLGVGAPLLAFSLVSPAFSRAMVSFFVKHSSAINRAAGVVLLGIAFYYLVFVFQVFGTVG